MGSLKLLSLSLSLHIYIYTHFFDAPIFVPLYLGLEEVPMSLLWGLCQQCIHNRLLSGNLPKLLFQHVEYVYYIGTRIMLL